MICNNILNYLIIYFTLFLSSKITNAICNFATLQPSVSQPVILSLA